MYPCICIWIKNTKVKSQKMTLKIAENVLAKNSKVLLRTGFRILHLQFPLYKPVCFDIFSYF